MSRTDVHTPLWVRERDPEWRHHFTPDHDHSLSDCDLEHRIANPHEPWKATSCHIQLVNRRRNICCGCRLCTGYYWRKQHHRRVRAQWRQDARLWLKGGSARPEKNLATW